MNIDIRKSIMANFKDAESKEIEEAIVSSIQDKEEITLPGLGVFFEILWQHSTLEEQAKIISTIQKNLV